jgi:hypothetical protein
MVLRGLGNGSELETKLLGTLGEVVHDALTVAFLVVVLPLVRVFGALGQHGDLVERFRRGAPLNAPDYARLYVGEEKGYTDYPTLAG